MTLPSPTTKVHWDAAGDDPKQARAEGAAFSDAINSLITHLASSAITNDPLTVGPGLEDGGTDLRTRIQFNVQSGASYTAVAGDRGKIIDFTGTGAKTLDLTAAATLTDGWYCGVRNSGASGDVTIDPATTEQVDGATTKIVGPGEGLTLVCSGSLFRTLGAHIVFTSALRGIVPASGGGTTNFLRADATWAAAGSTAPSIQVFTGSGTYTKPAGLKAAWVRVVGGGGGAAQASATVGSGGGGGGGYSEELLAAASIGSTETITIGTGGAAAGDNPGGTTSFGALLSATGGAGGDSGASGGAGGPGGTGSGGNVNATGGNGGNGGTTGGGDGGGTPLGQGGGGGSGASNGADGSLYGGGGGGGAPNGGGAAGKDGIAVAVEFY